MRWRQVRDRVAWAGSVLLIAALYAWFAYGVASYWFPVDPYR